MTWVQGSNNFAFLAALSLGVACASPSDRDAGGDADSADSAADAGTSSAEGSATAATTGTPGATADGTGASTNVTAGDDDDDGDDGPAPVLFDLGGIPDAPTFCNAGEGEVEASYIWIANSSQSTISKIDTQTIVEEGRYLTRSDAAGSPSRTSVSLTGNVAVANRNGGVTKFYANHDDCNGGAGSPTTSTDSTWLPWGDDECMAWHTSMSYASQRPVAWTQGEWDQAACRTVNEKVWTSGANATIDVLLLDGETGVIEETVPIPGVSPNFYGIYGAAVDSDGNFWGSQLGIGQLINVDLQTMAVQTWPMPASGYGMTVDADGYVWTCTSTASRFDPVSETWQTTSVPGASGGCMADANGILWMAGSSLRGINNQTLALDYTLVIPSSVHGVSVDFEGNVWGVQMGSNAYRVDPTTGTVDTFTGLVGAYTYSDMTGFALSNVGGGGAPSG
jgi:hypothetical protein